MFVLLILIFMTFVVLGLPNVFGSAWPAMYGMFGVPVASAGILSMIFGGSTVIGVLLSDKFINRFGSRNVTLFSLLIAAISLIGFAFSHAFWMLAFWNIPLGFGLGFIDAAINNVVANHYETKHMNWLHAFWGVGASIGPMIMSLFLARENNWQAGYGAVGIIYFVFIGIFMLTLKLWRVVVPVKADVEVSHPKSKSAQQLMTIPGVKYSLFIFFAYCALEASVGLWASTYLVSVRNLAEETAAFWLALYFLGITVGRFMAGFLTKLLKNRQLILVGVGLIAGGIILLLLPIPENFLLVALFLIGFGCAPIFPTLIHETPLNFGNENSQAIIGMQMGFAYIGAMLMPALFGVIAARTGHDLLPYYLGGFLVLMILMLKVLYQNVGDVMDDECN